MLGWCTYHSIRVCRSVGSHCPLSRPPSTHSAPLFVSSSWSGIPPLLLLYAMMPTLLILAAIIIIIVFFFAASLPLRGPRLPCLVPVAASPASTFLQNFVLLRFSDGVSCGPVGLSPALFAALRVRHTQPALFVGFSSRSSRGQHCASRLQHLRTTTWPITGCTPAFAE